MKHLFKIIVALLAITLGLLFWVQQDPGPGVVPTEKDVKSYLKITFLDVGQGDATFIEWPDGTQMLVDCAKDSRILEALGRVMNFYDRTIDYVLITHPDLDHFGGCQDVITRFKVDNIVRTGAGKDYLPDWLALESEISRQNANKIKIDREVKIKIGESQISYLYPDHSVENEWRVPGSEFNPDVNDTSIVFKLEFGNQSAIFTGDAEEPLEKYLIDKYKEELDVDLLKVGHHGSGSSSIEPFLDVVSPEKAVISAGKDNPYGHPTRRVLKRLERAGTEVMRTDQDGDVVIRIFSNRIDTVTVR
jgi:competence protein ComEC